MTNPAVLTGPAHLNTFKVDTIEMPDDAYKMPSSLTLASSPNTKVSVRGLPLDSEAESKWRSREGDTKTEFGTYEVKIPLK